ncbi:MAG: class I tRNA ligase family protein, partial [Oscillospiraceae bacterium]|nr:class I tRNA ligase family protein [Oscillospiraceae bacterium]
MAKELEKIYNPHDVEARLYKEWEEKGYFHAEVDETKEPFTIVIPPPNVTGQLHMGHAFDETLQDILIRYKRMQGYEALWVPGTDHAGIATQIKVEAELREKEGLTRYD